MNDNQLILAVLHNTTLTDELRDSEVAALAQIITIRNYKAGEVIVIQNDNNYEDELRDSLMILGSGELDVTYNTKDEAVTLSLLMPGDLCAVIGFVGGDVSKISAGVVAKTDCTVLSLSSRRFEALLNSQPAIVYYVMRSITRYVHGIMRSLNMQTMEMSNYLYHTKTRS
jgi:CRP-like cAMP-binding protein